MDQIAQNESLVTFRTSQGFEVRASLLRLSRHSASFEIYSPDAILRTSESLGEFKILVNDRAVYSGRAVVTDLVNAGTVVVCEADLDDFCFDAEFFSAISQNGHLAEQFNVFVTHWQQ